MITLANFCRSKCWLGIALAIALAAALVGTASAQDFQKGFDAYKRGDYAAALREWRPLAEQGEAAAQVNVGLMYSKGRGVPQDLVSAYMWFNLSAAQGNEDANKYKSLAVKPMTHEQIAEAQWLSREYFARIYKDC